MSPVIRPSEISRTWSAHGSSPPSGSGWYWPNAGEPLAVDRHQPRALAADARRRASSSRMSSWPLQPQLVRRHRQRGVLVQQRGQRVHVVALEGVDVAREQRLLLVVQRLGRGVGVAVSRSASVARARCSALLTEATVVSSSSATSLAFQRSTSRRISTARCRGGRCCSAATNASRIDSRGDGQLRRVAAGRAAPAASGIGSIQVASGSGGAERRVCGRRRAAEVHRPGPALRAVEHVEADVGGDAVQPRAQRGAALEPVEAPPGPHHRLLHGVLGLERRAEHPVAVAGELGAVRLQAVRQLALRRRPVHGAVRRRGFARAVVSLVEDRFIEDPPIRPSADHRHTRPTLPEHPAPVCSSARGLAAGDRARETAAGPDRAPAAPPPVHHSRGATADPRSERRGAHRMRLRRTRRPSMAATARRAASLAMAARPQSTVVSGGVRTRETGWSSKPTTERSRPTVEGGLGGGRVDAVGDGVGEAEDGGGRGEPGRTAAVRAVGQDPAGHRGRRVQLLWAGQDFGLDTEPVGGLADIDVGGAVGGGGAGGGQHGDPAVAQPVQVAPGRRRCRPGCRRAPRPAVRARLRASPMETTGTASAICGPALGGRVDG